MRSFVVAAWLLGVSAAYAGCQCVCIGGENQPICSSAMELPPLCPPRVCPIEPARVEPIQRPVLPPLGTSDCRQRQVLNPYTGQYEWRTVCR